eukprot:TRINITY_DN2299_c1_g1_i1.p4 TRINITY_DN2299_c1_g1~~TRINITY_DN2299_c1_g1_i1.p4  ORF type:complete len:137 (+),score=59.98 TRINITY_DN2299_c1_g1_i1:288-698(+)
MRRQLRRTPASATGSVTMRGIGTVRVGGLEKVSTEGVPSGSPRSLLQLPVREQRAAAEEEEPEPNVRPAPAAAPKAEAAKAAAPQPQQRKEKGGGGGGGGGVGGRAAEQRCAGHRLLSAARRAAAGSEGGDADSRR